MPHTVCLDLPRFKLFNTTLFIGHTAIELTINTDLRF